MATVHRSLADLADHLCAQRQKTIQTWREAVKADRTLTTAHSLPRNQLEDHIPGLLKAYELRLRTGASGVETAVAEQGEQAIAHGLHRWQQGYDLQEVSRELGRLNEAVVIQLEEYAHERGELEPQVMTAARRIWAEMIGIESSKSIAEYFRLRQVEAAGHVRDLEHALEKIRELEQQRAGLWHQAAHDLRGNLSVVVTATAGLNRVGATQPAQERFLRVLDRNVASLHQLLDDVIDLARLQAGKEVRRVAKVDVASLLSEIVDGLHVQAEQRELFLRQEGPAPFFVEGDAVKVRRLVQNLVVNAIKYTKQGGVTVSWGDIEGNDGKRWMVSVQDTGPGFAAGPGSPLVGALEQATEASGQATGETRDARVDTGPQHSAVHESPQIVHQQQGEGIGLSIVKRLAELLDATVEVQSDSAGTTFKVLLPRKYAS